MTDTKLTGLGLRLVGENLYAALPVLQKRIEAEQGAKDLTVEVIIGDIHDQTAFTDPRTHRVRMSLTVHLEHPDGIGDIASSTFRACSYALQTILREQLRHRSVRESGRRLVPAGVRLEAGMPVGESELSMILEIVG